jgi:putative transcriptional regulator
MSSDANNKITDLKGKLLLAMPQMGDVRFHKAVILMCAHDEEGAMGLIVNHLLPGIHLAQLMGQLDIEIAEEAKEFSEDFPVMSGGPVETARGFVVHSEDFKQDDTIKVKDDIFITGTLDALRAIASGDGPDQMRFILGYAGWSAGQLDNEMKQNAWLVTDADPELIFNEEDGDVVWDKAIATLGFDPAMLSESAGSA